MFTYQLVEPTDFEILEVLADGRRNVASNIAAELDRDRAYINSQLGSLASQGLIRKIGPVDNSGLYEICPAGIAALDERHRFPDDQEAFTDRVQARAAAIEIQPPAIHREETA